MRVMLDTNVLLSTLLFPNKRINGMMQCIFEEHRLVLSSFAVEELSLVVKENFPAKAAAVDHLLSAMSYEYVYTPQGKDRGRMDILDVKDELVLSIAVMENVDVLITNDRDFAKIEVERPEILTPARFIRRFLIR